MVSLRSDSRAGVVRGHALVCATACLVAAGAGAAELEVGPGLDPFVGLRMAQEQLGAGLDNVCSDPDATWTSASGPILAPCGTATDRSILGPKTNLPAWDAGFRSTDGGSLKIRAAEGGIELAGEASPRLELWRADSGHWAIGFDPSAKAHLGISDLSLDAIKADSLADVPLSLHGGPASAHLSLVRSGWAAGEPFWLSVRPERLELAAAMSGIPLPDRSLELHGGAMLTIGFGTNTKEFSSRLGIRTASAWKSDFQPGATISLRALDAPGAELLTQLRATTEFTYHFRSGGQFRVTVECFDRNLLSGAAEGRGLILRLRL